jgi:MFS family permease
MSGQTLDQVAPDATDGASEGTSLAVFRIRAFSLLWLSQVATQVGGNMVIYGLTVLIYGASGSNSAVSVLLLTFLAPAVLFSSLAGVYVDRVDRRLVLIVANLARAAFFALMIVLGGNLIIVYLLNIAVATTTTFFGPAELSMIPFVVPRRLLLSANAVFTLTANAAFAVGFALLGPLVVKLAGPTVLIGVVAVCYVLAAAFCWTLPAARPARRDAAEPGERSGLASAIGTVLAQLGEGIAYVRDHRPVAWSLAYLSLSATIIGVLGALGPGFATHVLGLRPDDFVVVVLPLGAGVVTGVLLLNRLGKLVSWQRLIEGGLVGLGIGLALLSIVGPISLALQRRIDFTRLPVDASVLVSVLALVISVAFPAGIAYAFIAIPAQTELQEELPERVRGRIFGILNMLSSVASFLPIIVIGPLADLVGLLPVILGSALLTTSVGVASIVLRRPPQAAGGVSPDLGHLGP